MNLILLEVIMFDLIMKGGPYMYLLVLFSVMIIGLSIKKAFDLFGSQDRTHSQMESGIHAIVFWGGISLLIGLFSHFHGLYLAMQAISRANDISPAIVAEGYGLSLITILAGLFIFIFSLILWFVFRWRVKRLRSDM
jgi:biopolymer transport protein ExbB/TolQ